jgi:hypothetical protein
VAIETNRADPDFVVVKVHYRGSSPFGCWAYYTSDGGATWNGQQITAHYQTTSFYGTFPSVFVSARTPGRAWVGAHTVTNSDVAALARVYETLDYGASWALSTVFNFTMKLNTGDGFHVPYTNENYLFYGDFETSVFDPYTRRNSTTIYAPASGNNKAYQRGIRTDDNNGNRAVLCAGGKVMSTTNALGGATLVTLATGTNYESVAVVGNGYISWGGSGAMGAGSSLSVPPVDKRGNLTADFPSAGKFRNIMGLSV